MTSTFYRSRYIEERVHKSMSSGGAGTSEQENSSAGCSLSEQIRPGIDNNSNNNNNNNNRNNNNNNNGNWRNNINGNDIDNRDLVEGGLVVFTWGRGEDGQLGLGGKVFEKIARRTTVLYYNYHHHHQRSQL